MLAFEPYAPIRARLLRNIALNRALRIEVRNEALSGASGQGFLLPPQSADNEGTAGLIEDGAGAIEIQRERLDRLLHVPPDFVKVDVEGHESRVFEGMSALLGRDEAPTLMFESFRIEEDRSMLEKFGYSVFAPCLRGGELGVLVFFVLSGFLITTILLEERTAYGNVDLRAFYIRRALRLLPAFVVFIATMACLKGLGHVPGESWGSFVAALTL